MVHRVTTNDNEWHIGNERQRAKYIELKSMTASDSDGNNWQRMTASDSKGQRVAKRIKTNENEWEQLL